MIKNRQIVSELTHNLAIICWITANSLWMIFEFTGTPDFDFIKLFSKQINVPIRDNVLEIPKTLGAGYVRKVGFGDDFRLTIHRYKLKEDLIVKQIGRAHV